MTTADNNKTHLFNELVRALTGKQLHRYVAEEFAKEHGLDVRDEFVTEIGKAIGKGLSSQSDQVRVHPYM